MGYGVGALQNSRTPLPPVRPRRTPAGTAWSPGCAAREGGATQGELGPPLSRAARSSAQTEAGFTISGDFRTVGKDGYLSGDFLSNFGYFRVNINPKIAKFSDSQSIRMPHSALTFDNGIAASGNPLAPPKNDLRSRRRVGPIRLSQQAVNERLLGLHYRSPPRQ